MHHVSFYSSLESTVDHKNIPDFEVITKNQGNNNNTEIRSYFFEERTEELWDQIRTFIQWHKEKNFETSSFQFNFYDSDFFHNKDLSTYNYGFKRSGEMFFETEYFEHLEAQLLFTLKLEDQIPTAKALEGALNTSPNKYIVKPHGF